MEKRELGEAKTLWRKFHASVCFMRAKDAAKYIYDKNANPNDSLFNPLTCALHIYYSSPFTNWKGIGSLDEKKIVPKEYLELHKQLIDFRDKVYAHRNGEEIFHIPDFGPAIQVRAKRHRIDSNTTGTGNVYAAEPAPAFADLPRIIKLCEKLHKTLYSEANDIYDEYRGRVPKAEGEYFLNVTDINGPMWVPAGKAIVP